MQIPVACDSLLEELLLLWLMVASIPAAFRDTPQNTLSTVTCIRSYPYFVILQQQTLILAGLSVIGQQRKSNVSIQLS